MVVIGDQNGGKMWERQIVEIKSLLFLQVQSSREEQFKEDAVSIKQPETMFEQFLVQFVPAERNWFKRRSCHVLNRND